MVLYFSYYTVINFLMLSAILLSTLSALFSTIALSSLLCDQASALWNNSNWLVDFNIEKTQLVLFDGSNNTGAIDVKKDGSALE